MPRFCGSPCQQRAGRRRRGEVSAPPEACKGCGASLAGRHSTTRFCSPRCQSWCMRNGDVPHPSATARTCRQCEVPIDERDVRSVYCSALCRDRFTMGYVVGAPRICPQCGVEFLTRRKSSRFCGPRCVVVADFEQNREDYLRRSKARRAMIAGARVERFSSTQVFERDHWICYLCGDPVNRDAEWPAPNGPSVDHVIPLVRGGEHSLANTRCSHLGCNLSKGVKLLA